MPAPLPKLPGGSMLQVRGEEPSHGPGIAVGHHSGFAGVLRARARDSTADNAIQKVLGSKHSCRPEKTEPFEGKKESQDEWLAVGAGSSRTHEAKTSNWVARLRNLV